MTSSFRQSISGTRFDPDTNVKGRLVPGGSSPLNFTASVQPLSGDENLTLPESLRESQNYWLYTDTKLQTTDEKNKTKADQVTLFSKTFQIIRVEAWQNGVIPHYKALASLIN